MAAFSDKTVQLVAALKSEGGMAIIAAIEEEVSVCVTTFLMGKGGIGRKAGKKARVLNALLRHFKVMTGAVTKAAIKSP